MSYPVVSFISNGRTARAEFTVKMPNSFRSMTFLFKFHCEDDYSAELLTAHLCKTYTEAIRTVKREAYNLGYRDGRAKRAKRKEFCGDLDPCWESM